MTKNPLGPDHHLAPSLRADDNLLARIEGIANTVLRRLGDDPTDATRTNGWVNPGWMSDRHVIRVALTAGRGHLRREADLAAHLPPEVGYPAVIEAGLLDDREYLVTRRIDAGNLREAWHDLDIASRARSLRQLWERAEVIHSVDLGWLNGIELDASPFFPTVLEEAVGWLDHLGARSILTDGDHHVLTGHLDAFYTALGGANRVLCHGDLYTGNALWDGENVVGLVDLEFAVIGPAEIDCNELTKIAFAHRTIDDATGPPDPVEQAVTDIARSIPAHPDLLTGYAILLETFLIAQDLSYRGDDDVAASKRARLLAALAALARPDRGHLARVVR